MFTMNRHLLSPLFSYFNRVYKLQDGMNTFDNVHEFLASLSPSCPPMLKTSIRDLLRSQGYSDLFVDEIVFAATNVNYNQNTDIHGFVGAVALAGAQDGLWSVWGGNKQIPKALLDHSQANHISKRVHTVTLLPNAKYGLGVHDVSHVYDYVILACPIIENSATTINFEGFPNPVIEPIKYQRTVTTLIHGDLNHAYFNCKSAQDLPNLIFSTNNELFFSSITVIYPVKYNKKYDEKVYKIFSKEELTNDQLDLLFLKYDNVTVIDWLATPQYDTSDKNLNFEPYKNLFYVNAIEWAASAMEMSAISGVNAALHVIKRVDRPPTPPFDPNH
uniref:Prenylcysteine lyase domain-containing protein n=1 Tax=Graphocephala atropunctata TaxID=36148 RepID=A0A1B6KFF6_9HEMI